MKILVIEEHMRTERLYYLCFLNSTEKENFVRIYPPLSQSLYHTHFCWGIASSHDRYVYWRELDAKWESPLEGRQFLQ